MDQLNGVLIYSKVVQSNSIWQEYYLEALALEKEQRELCKQLEELNKKIASLRRRYVKSVKELG